MTLHGRSLDDLPLAAYTTGVEPDPGLEDDAPAAAPEPAPAPTFAPPALGAVPAFGSGGGGATMATRRLAFPAIPALPPWLANPRAHLRDPRLQMTSVVGVGVVLLAGSLLLGGGSSAGAGPAASPSAAPVVVATVAPPSGDATVEVNGKLTASYAMLGARGTGAAAGGRIDARWADAAGSSLGLAGSASPGTRRTDATFTLTLTVLVDGATQTFTSDRGECTVGMAVQHTGVTGSFVCKKLKSDDGELTLEVRGTYRT